MRGRLKRWYKSAEMPVLVFLFVVFLAHFFFPNRFADDEWFYAILAEGGVDGEGVISFVVSRFASWSSRVPMEAGNIVFVRWFWLWRFLDVAMYALVFYYICRLFNPERSRKKYVLILISVLFFPLWVFYEVGFVTTSLNYLWPFALALPALSVLARRFLSRSVSLKAQIFSLLPLAFSLFQEVLCMALLLCAAGALLCRWIRDKKPPIYEAVLLLLCGGMMLYALFCPGNVARTAAETALRFPEHAGLSLFEKAELGFSSMGRTLFLTCNVTVLLFTALLAFAVFMRKKDILWRVLSVIPFAFSFLFAVFGTLFPFSAFRSLFGKTGTGISLSPLSWIPCLVIALLLGLILLLLWQVLADKKTYFVCFFLLGVGAATRIALGFSPTVWDSGNRTCTYLYFAFSFTVGAVLFSLFKEKRD